MRAVTRENERGGSARPIRMLRFVYRVFWLCQSRMGIDPIDSHKRKYDLPGEMRQALRLSRSCTASDHFDHNDTP
jgi:hypothetical protein